MALARFSPTADSYRRSGRHGCSLRATSHAPSSVVGPVACYLWLWLALAGGADAASAVHRYEVVAGPQAAELTVEATIAPGRDGQLCVQSGYGPFVRDLERRVGRRVDRPSLDGSCLAADACEKDGCTLRYRFALAEAARARRNRSNAFEHNGAILSRPSTWLLSPTDPRPGCRYRLVVKTSPGLDFVSGATLASDGSNAYEGLTSELMDGPYAGFGAFERARVEAGKARVDVAVAPGEHALPTAALVTWVKAAADSLVAYYGRYPVPRALVIILPGGRRGVGFGSGMGNGGASVMISVGKDATAEDLRGDWVLRHEMIHLALPNLPRQQHWLEEGLATYLEPILRARAGIATPEQAWAELVKGIPNGVRAMSERGFDGGGWAMTYWGGALFCLLADVDIREKTDNARALDDALRGINAEGSIADNWSFVRLLAAGDAATGTSVLHDLYARGADKPYPVAIESLWARLGVVPEGGAVRLDDHAPLARLRRAITAPDGRPLRLSTPRP